MTMPTGWQDRHPFKIGDRIRHRAQKALPDRLMVTMRGEDEHGPWITVNEGWQRLDARHYEAEAVEG